MTEMRLHRIILILAVAAGLVGSDSLVAQQPGAIPPAAVHVAKLQQQDVAGGLTFVGDVVAVRHSIIGSAVAGRVDQVYVREGESIGMETNADDQPIGQPLVQLRVKTANLELAAAAAELRLRERELEELERGSREEEKIQARARLESAEALLKFATQKLERTQRLFERGAGATAAELDEAVSAHLAAEKDVVAARAGLEMVLQGPRDEVIEQARARLDMASERVAMLADIVSKYTVRTPFNGYVVEQFVEEGAWVSQGDPVAEVVELSPIEVRVAVPEISINKVQRGSAVRVEVDSLPGVLMTGTVHRVVPLADVRARTFPVLVRLDNPMDGNQFLLMPGMLARVTFAAGSARSALMAPKDALIWNGQNVSMYVAQPGEGGTHVARPIPVQLGVVEGSMFEVIDTSESIQPDDLVVTVGNERLRPGQPLRILKVENEQTSQN